MNRRFLISRKTCTTNGWSTMTPSPPINSCIPIKALSIKVWRVHPGWDSGSHRPIRLPAVCFGSMRVRPRARRSTIRWPAGLQVIFLVSRYFEWPACCWKPAETASLGCCAAAEASTHGFAMPSGAASEYLRAGRCLAGRNGDQSMGNFVGDGLIFIQSPLLDGGKPILTHRGLRKARELLRQCHRRRQCLPIAYALIDQSHVKRFGGTEGPAAQDKIHCPP